MFMNARPSAKAVAGAVRDLVVLRCVRVAGQDSEDEFLGALDEAFGGGLFNDKDLKSQLLNSFHHVVGGAGNAFKSRGCQCRRRGPSMSPALADEEAHGGDQDWELVKEAHGGGQAWELVGEEAHGGDQACQAPQPGSCWSAMPAQQTASVWAAASGAIWPCAVGCVVSESPATPADHPSQALVHGWRSDAQRRAMSGGVQAVPSIPCQSPAVAAQQVFPTLPPGGGRRVVAVHDPATGVSTLQYTGAHSHEREEEVAPMQPHQGATKCQACRDHDPRGWQDAWMRFYCVRSDRGGPRHPDCTYVACSGTEKCSLNVPRSTFGWRYRLQYSRGDAFLRGPVQVLG